MHAPSSFSNHSSFRFSFENLRVFQSAQQALLLVVEAKDSLRGAPGELASQLNRALVSVCLNLAEGAGRKSAADQARLYQIAYGSAAEAMAALLLLRTLGLGGTGLDAAEQRLREAEALCLHLIRATSR